MSRDYRSISNKEQFVNTHVYVKQAKTERIEPDFHRSFLRLYKSSPDRFILQLRTEARGKKVQRYMGCDLSFKEIEALYNYAKEQEAK